MSVGRYSASESCGMLKQLASGLGLMVGPAMFINAGNKYKKPLD